MKTIYRWLKSQLWDWWDEMSDEETAEFQAFRF